MFRTEHASATPVMAVAAAPSTHASGHTVLTKGLTSATGFALIGLMGLVEVGLRVGHFFGRRFG
ncbi:MAG: hypothetical protein ABWY56_03135 [Propionibacteriaceae bacterium]